MSLSVHSIETFGTHEGPGIRLVIFLQGCHFRCVYCHNPDTWSTQAGEKMEIPDILNLLKKQKPYLLHGGLTVSGGEPLIQRVEVCSLFEQAKKVGIHTTLDTNGSIFDEFTNKLLEVTDLVLLDVKHIDDIQHQKVTGQSNQRVLDFAQYLSEIKKPYWLRYVLVPGWTDQTDSLHAWGKYFQHSAGLERVEILPFHTLGAYKYKALKIKNPLEGLQPPDQNTIENAKHIFEHYFQEVIVR